jgi:subtilisin family serine protease
MRSATRLPSEPSSEPRSQAVGEPERRWPMGALAAPPPASTMWNLLKIRWSQARALPGFVDAGSIKVAVLDTGVDANHPDLSGKVAAYEFSHPSISSASTDQDIIGQGTHVSGTITARVNGIGINGICDCLLHVLKIFDDQHDGYSPDDGYYVYYVDPVMYGRALSRCLTLGVHVVNLSIGGGGAPSAQESALFAALISAGTTVVASMGNTGTPAVMYPAAVPNVIAVGATNIDDTLASFSTTGSHIALSAPGVGIWSTLPTYAGNFGFFTKPSFPFAADLSNPVTREKNYDAWQGTSMASPHVAAAAALLLAKSPGLTPAAVKTKLQSSAVKVPAMGGAAFTNGFGAGRLDLVNLLSP